MKGNLNTRQQKLTFLQQLEKGKASINTFLQPITALQFVDGGKVWMEVTKDGAKYTEEDVEGFRRKYPKACTHTIIFEDYSIENNNKNL